MAKPEEIKKILAPILLRAGVSQEDQNSLFNINEGLSEELSTSLGTNLSNLHTIQAAEANDDLRKRVIRSTMEKMEAKLKNSALAAGLTEPELEPIWQKKHLTEKADAIVKAIQSKSGNSTPENFVPKAEFDALKHNFTELETKHKSGAQGWLNTIENHKSEYKQLQTELETYKTQSEAQRKEAESMAIDNELLGYVRGQIKGDDWFVKATENEILAKTRATAAIIRGEDSRTLIARNPQNTDIAIYGENQTIELTPKDLVLKIANELGALDNGGADDKGGRRRRSEQDAPEVPDTRERGSNGYSRKGGRRNRRTGDEGDRGGNHRRQREATGNEVAAARGDANLDAIERAMKSGGYDD